MKRRQGDGAAGSSLPCAAAALSVGGVLPRPLIGGEAGAAADPGRAPPRGAAWQKLKSQTTRRARDTARLDLQEASKVCVLAPTEAWSAACFLNHSRHSVACAEPSETRRCRNMSLEQRVLDGAQDVESNVCFPAGSSRH